MGQLKIRFSEQIDTPATATIADTGMPSESIAPVMKKKKKTKLSLNLKKKKKTKLSLNLKKIKILLTVDRKGIVICD